MTASWYICEHGVDLTQPPPKASSGNFRCGLIADLRRGGLFWSGGSFHIRDVAGDPDISLAMRTMGVGSTIAVPLLRDGQPLGAFAIGLTTPGGFTESQVALFQTFAEQAVIAITSVGNSGHCANAPPNSPAPLPNSRCLRRCCAR